jgi:hypothetical protein
MTHPTQLTQELQNDSSCSIKADDLRLAVAMGLQMGLKLIRGMRRSLSDDDEHKIASAIVEQLQQSDRKIEQGPMREGHRPHRVSE